jgi:hypothetical protein
MIQKTASLVVISSLLCFMLDLPINGLLAGVDGIVFIIASFLFYNLKGI